MTRIAVITGGSKGLGKSIITRLQNDDWMIYEISRSKELEDIHNKTTHIECDLRERSSLLKIPSLIADRKIDLLINNAASIFNDEFDSDTLNENYDDIFNVNFFTPVFLSLQLNHRLKKGKIINISSDLSYLPVESMALYSASKSALNNYFVSYSKHNKDIKIVNILPSMMDTVLTRKLIGEKYNDFKDRILSSEKVADKIIDIVTNEDYETGSEIFISSKMSDYSKESISTNKFFIELDS